MASSTGTSSIASRGWTDPLLPAAVLLLACTQPLADTNDPDMNDPGTGADNSGVVLVYHHVDDDTPESTSVTPERFRQHLDHLEDNDFNVWSLPRLIEAAREGREIPARTVAFTFDDAYQSVLDRALPMMQERDWPFTVFVSTDSVGSHDIYLDWDELRTLEDAGVTIANHTVNHPHMARPRDGESEDEWLERVEGEIVDAQQRLEDELASPARILAWPYGESSPPVEQLLIDLEFTGVSQHSGAIATYSHNFAALPRFPMAAGYDDMDDFALKTRTRALPVRAIEPADGVLDADAGRPAVELELMEGPYDPAAISCYARGQTIDAEVIGEDPATLRVQATEALPVGRTTYNCTAPAHDADRWYWYSVLWMKPREDGTWYDW